MTLMYNGKECMQKASPREVFEYWIRERLNVLNSVNLNLPKPWSEDPIFRSVYFCNVQREEDKVTKYIRSWAAEDETENLLGVYTLARLINWPDTLKEIDPNKIKRDPEYIFNTLKNIRKTNKKIFSGAYLITTCGIKMDKLEYVMRVVNDVTRVCLPQDTLQKQWEELIKIQGLGNFLAAQIVADLKNTQDTTWSRADDFLTFVASGPGSIKGLNYYNNIPPEKGMSTSKFKELLDAARFNLYKDNPTLPKLCNQDLQNCFCEFSKYMRVLSGGRTKRNYHGW